jgi:hypothetical protein
MFAIIIGCPKEAGTAYPSRAPEITPGFLALGHIILIPSQPVFALTP